MPTNIVWVLGWPPIPLYPIGQQRCYSIPAMGTFQLRNAKKSWGSRVAPQTPPFWPCAVPTSPSQVFKSTSAELWSTEVWVFRTPPHNPNIFFFLASCNSNTLDIQKTPLLANRVQRYGCLRCHPRTQTIFFAILQFKHHHRRYPKSHLLAYRVQRYFCFDYFVFRPKGSSSHCVVVPSGFCREKGKKHPVFLSKEKKVSYVVFIGCHPCPRNSLLPDCRTKENRPTALQHPLRPFTRTRQAHVLTGSCTHRRGRTLPWVC